MKKLRYTALLAAGLILVSCQETLQDLQDKIAQEQIKVIQLEVTPYEFSGGKTVTRVKSSLTNLATSLEFYYTVQIDANGQLHVDSIPLYMEKGDTVKTEIIFTELLYKENQELPLVHFIYPIREEAPAETEENPAI
jgi:hypothetical protein